VKHVATGEGGAVLTNSREFYEKLNSFRSHGMVKKNFINEPHGGWYMEMQELGCNYRITDIQCALGASQMKKLDRSVERRTEIAQMYDKTFEGDERISVPPRRKDRLNAYHLYPVRLRQERKRVYDRLIEEGIYAQVHYLPVYMHPYYRRNGFEGFSEPSAEAFYTQELSIPMYPAMSDDDVMYIIDKLKTILSEIR
jgi:dTDP-4-amino-4,6-dideoxygalactose transaminase